MRISVLRSLALAGALSAAAAAAQLPSPTGWDQATILNLQSTTRCLANGRPGLARIFVEGDSASPAYRRDRERMLHLAGFCALRPGAFRSDMLRGALAEALYVQRFGTSPFVPAAAAPVPSTGFALPEIADCIVARQPAAVDLLVRTEWKSAAEQQAVERLQGEIPACARPGPLPPLTTVIRFRLALALALYTRSQGTH